MMVIKRYTCDKLVFSFEVKVRGRLHRIFFNKGVLLDGFRKCSYYETADRDIQQAIERSGSFRSGMIRLDSQVPLVDDAQSETKHMTEYAAVTNTQEARRVLSELGAQISPAMKKDDIKSLAYKMNVSFPNWV